MISAFGVQHSINKSLVRTVTASGKIKSSFKPITQTTTQEKGQIARGGAYSDAKRAKIPGHDTFPGDYKQGLDALKMKDVGNGLRLRPAEKAKVDRTDALGRMGAGFTLRMGGKNTGKSYIAAGSSTRKGGEFVLRHEQQHAKPKRSAYRLGVQIRSDPKKLMREEARADYLAGGHYSNRVGRKLNKPLRDTDTAYLSGGVAGRRALQGKKTTTLSHRQLGDREKVKLRSKDLRQGQTEALSSQFSYPLKGKKAFEPYMNQHDRMLRRGTRQGRR